MSDLDSKRLKELLDYNPETGIFTWKISQSGPRKQGQIAGTKNKDGYIVIRHKKLYYAHRLAWLYMYNIFPDSIIDHINRDKSDNRIVNLRSVSQSDNVYNRTANGFAKPKQTKKWSASITVNRKRKHLGYFFSKEEAHKAYIEAKRIYHPSAPENLFVL
jgi:hypothetical protein